MKHAIIAACGAVAVAGTLTLAAQTPPRPQAPRPSPSTPSRTDEKAITVTGCLKAWDATTGAAAATPAPADTVAGAPAGRFVLTNVEPDVIDGASEAAPTSGAAARSTTESKQYVLTADAGVNLAAHLNHKVRLTGKATPMADHSAAGATARPTEPSRPGEMPPPAPAEPGHATPGHDVAKAFTTLAVSSVTMISASCTGATD